MAYSRDRKVSVARIECERCSQRAQDEGGRIRDQFVWDEVAWARNLGFF